MLLLWVVVILGVVVGDLAAPLRSTSALLVNTTSGPIQGATTTSKDGFSARQWIGVPFASPPVDKLRWAPPQPPQSWTEVRNVTQYGPACTQPDNELFNISDSSEDCLYLNVWAPLNPSSRNLSTMVFIHGGANLMGTGANYDGASIAAQTNSLVITINYRLGAFGFLALPALLKEHDTTGNYAFLDQLAAVRWVKDNAVAFGGDSEDMMIFGESAGGAAVFSHLFSPLSKDLFGKALIESGVFVGSQDQSLADASAAGRKFVVDDLHCLPEALGCLRKASAAKILKLGSSLPTTPVVDGMYLTKSIEDYLSVGDIPTRVTLVAGANAQEAGYLCDSDANITAEGVIAQTTKTFGQETSNAIWTNYSMSDYASPLQALIAVMSDQTVKCPTWNITKIMVALNHPTYLYSFEYRHHAYPVCNGAAHTTELIFLWPNWLEYFNTTYDNFEASLSKDMIEYWGNFAKSKKNTINGGPPAWSPFSTNHDTMVLSSQGVKVAAEYWDAHCAFWAEHPQPDSVAI